MLRTLNNLSLFIIVISVLVMIGWWLDIDILKTILPNSVTMKFTTALSFFIGGLILFLTLKKESQRDYLGGVLLPGLSLFLLILMGITFMSALLGFKSGVEHFLVKENFGAILTVEPSQPSSGTMIGFILAALLGVFAMSNWEKRKLAYGLTGIVISTLGIIALVGYIFDRPLLYYAVSGHSSAMAIHTATLFVLLGACYFLLYLNLRGKDSQNKKTR